MPNIASVLKAEIIRLAKKEISAAVKTVKKENAALRKSVAALQKDLRMALKLSRAGAKAAKQALPDSASDEQTERISIRPTGVVVRRLREKFGMSQDEFARLVQVGRITVSRWETTEGKIGFRGAATKKRFAEVMKFGKREAWAAIGKEASDSAEEPKPAKRGRPAKKAVVDSVTPKAPAKRGRPAKKTAENSGQTTTAKQTPVKKKVAAKKVGRKAKADASSEKAVRPATNKTTASKAKVKKNPAAKTAKPKATRAKKVAVPVDSLPATSTVDAQ